MASEIATYDNIRTKVNAYDSDMLGGIGLNGALNELSQEWYSLSLATTTFAANNLVGKGICYNTSLVPYYDKNTSRNVYMITELDAESGYVIQIYDSTTYDPGTEDNQVTNIDDFTIGDTTNTTGNPVTLDISAGTGSPVYSAAFSFSDNYYPLVSSTRTVSYNYCYSGGNLSGSISVDASLLASKYFNKVVDLPSSSYYFGTQSSADIYKSGTFGNDNADIYNTYMGTRTQTNHWHYPTHVDVSFYGSAAYAGTLHWKTDRFNTEPITLTYSLAYVASGRSIGSCTTSAQLTIPSSTAAQTGSVSISNSNARYWGTTSSSTNMFCLCSISTTDASVVLSSSTGSCVADCSYTESTSYIVSYTAETVTDAGSGSITTTISQTAAMPFDVTYGITLSYKGNGTAKIANYSVVVSAGTTTSNYEFITTYLTLSVTNVTITPSPTTYNGNTVTYNQTGNDF